MLADGRWELHFRKFRKGLLLECMSKTHQKHTHAQLTSFTSCRHGLARPFGIDSINADRILFILVQVFEDVRENIAAQNLLRGNPRLVCCIKVRIKTGSSQ